MKRFKDLELVGPEDRLLAVIEAVTADLPKGWVRDKDAEGRLAGVSAAGEEAGFAFARDATENEPGSGVFVAREAGRLYVPNIVPRESGRLSMSQYNRILDEFAGILRNHIAKHGDISLNVTNDEVGITEWISPEAADLLSRFSILANMSTGSSHPLDFKRWAEFLIQVHREGSALDAGTLEQWLVEELDWPADSADRLAIQYEFARSLLRIYNETQ